MAEMGVETSPELAGWRPLSEPNPFNTLLGPFFERNDGLEPGEFARFAFRVQPHHCNQRETCHGGMLSAFLDMALSRGLSAAEGFFGSTPTVSLTLDFFASAPLGGWIESRVTMLNRTNRMAFLQALLVSGDATLVRGSGVYMRPRKPAG